MSTDNRYKLNDCEVNTGWSGDDTANAISTAGSFLEGSGALATQLSNSKEHMLTIEDSTATGAYTVDMSDMTLYCTVKDNLHDTFTNGGMMFVIGDGTDAIGYDTAGNDAVGFPVQLYFHSYKMDVSVHVASPGTNNAFTGTEAALDQTVITQIGYASLHLAKAVGSIDNVIMDGFYYMANGSYALTINGGTSGTPETMTDAVGDDIAAGWSIINNPLGSLYGFFAPTEWGNSAITADHYFAADGEQWFWIGDNQGGHAVGSGNFPFRLVSNATDTGSWVVSNTSIVNTGVRSQFLMDDANFDIVEMNGCQLSGLGAIGLPSSGGTSRFTTSNIFTDCEQITHNGADLSGSSIFVAAVVADEGALLYDETTDPDTVMDSMSFSKGATAHHAIRFGTNVPATITLRNCDFVGFGASNDANDSVFRFDDTSGNITLNLVNCTNDGSGFTVDDTAGVTVTVVIDPVTTLVNVKDNDGANLINARVYLRASNGTGPLPFEDSVTITRETTTATVAHTAHGMATNDKIKVLGITDKTEDNAGVHQITVTGTDAYTYSTTDSGSTSYNGAITSTWVALEGLTNASGNISLSKTYGSNQPVTGRAAKSTTSPRFKAFPLNGTINSSTGLTINIQMIIDE